MFVLNIYQYQEIKHFTGSNLITNFLAIKKSVAPRSKAQQYEKKNQKFFFKKSF